MWIKRDLSTKLREISSPALLLTGPRQCGKSSLLQREFKEAKTYITLDDLNERSLARENPKLFLNRFPTPLIIDEIQYAPELFSEIKIRIDKNRNENKHGELLYILSGSNQILLKKNVSESLAGRCAFLELNTLSLKELLRSKTGNIEDFIFQGGWPELYANKKEDPANYLNNYILSYIEKDIVLSAGIRKEAQFLKFLKLLAARTGTLVNYTELGNQLDIDQSTLKEWISILENMKIICSLAPYSNNLSKRLIKKTKIHFLDMGLCARLQGWTNKAALINSPNFGDFFESLVFSEFYKEKINHLYQWNFFHIRSKDGQEIDLAIEENNQLQLFEVKIKAPIKKYKDLFSIVNKGEFKKLKLEESPFSIICLDEDFELKINNQQKITGIGKLFS